MKVALELQPCLKNKSGIGVYTYELSKRLQIYENLELVGNIFNFINRNDLTMDLQELDFKKSYCRVFPYGIYRRIWHSMPISYNALFKEKVDITHFFNFIVPPKIEGKVINTIHDLTFKFYPDTMDERNLKRIRQDIDYSIERSDIITTVSECSKWDIVKELKVPPEYVKVISPGVDYKNYSRVCSSEEKRLVKEKYKLPEGYVLYMGTLEPRKNILGLVEAFARLKNEEGLEGIKLVLAGKKGWLYESIFKRINELNLEDEVIFTGYVDEKDKVVIYQLARCFVFPSLYEGFGIPILEAMAASVPVITANVSSLPEVAGEAALLTSPLDNVKMAECIFKVLTDEILSENLIAKGLKQVQKYTWDESADELYRLYMSLI